MRKLALGAGAHRDCAAKSIGDCALVAFESVADAAACPCPLEVCCRGSLRRYSQEAQVLFDCYEFVPIGVDRRERRRVDEFKRREFSIPIGVKSLEYVRRKQCLINRKVTVPIGIDQTEDCDLLEPELQAVDFIVAILINFSEPSSCIGK